MSKHSIPSKVERAQWCYHILRAAQQCARDAAIVGECTSEGGHTRFILDNIGLDKIEDVKDTLTTKFGSSCALNFVKTHPPGSAGSGGPVARDVKKLLCVDVLEPSALDRLGISAPLFDFPTPSPRVLVSLGVALLVLCVYFLNNHYQGYYQPFARHIEAAHAAWASYKT
jgi:hypothetical protein